MLFKTRITEIGPEVGLLAQDGILILFAEGAPPELAEVSVLHAVETLASESDPAPGHIIRIGDLESRITAVGPAAWKKVREIGHVVINFNNATAPDRPGEICATHLDGEILIANLSVGNTISIA